MSASAKPFSEAIRVARRGSNQSQEEVARAVGVTQNTISAWERGVQLPAISDAERLPRLAGQLGLGVDELRVQLRAQELQASVGEEARDEPGGLALVDAHVQRLGPASTRVWVTVSDRLPAEAFPDWRDAWAGWIQAGVEVHVVWFLDLVSPRRMDHAGRCLWELAPRIRQAWRDRPGLVHYPVVAFDREAAGPSLDVFLELAREEIPKNVFQEVRVADAALRRHVVARCAGGGITVIVPKTLRGGPLAVQHVAAAGGPGLRERRDVWIPLEREAGSALMEVLEETFGKEDR